MKMAKLALPVLAILFSAFAFWSLPAMSDQKLAITAGTISQLKQLKPTLNFEADGDRYTGILDPVERAQADADLAALIDMLVNELPRHPYQSFVEQQIKRTYSPLRLADTEDREAAVRHFQKILKVVGVQNSGRFLNILLYGPVLGEMVSK
jgi:hypothetical protein